MRRCWPLASYLLLLTLAASVRAQATDAQGERLFETKIRPILVEHCYACHSQNAKKIRGGLLLDRRETLHQGGDSGPVVVPGHPEQSLLIQALRHEKDLQMPPKGKLSAMVIADFVRWVELGAPDPRDAGKSATPRRVFTITEADRKHWAFRPLAHAAAPPVQNKAWCQSEIDAFILARLEQRGLRPSPPADRYALLRRATFDLTGLPPTPEEIRSFLNDDSPGAFARVVDRLLASKEFGARWGRHWLDGVRYASDVDKSGLYRDWVVRAFNQDMPYSRFVELQLAGDLIPPEESEPNRVHASGASLDGITATGMLALAVWERVGRDLAVAEIVDTQIDLVGRQLLGITLACARCHDHKFDPISTKDYYGLAGIFFSSHISPGTLVADGRLSDDVIGIPLLTRTEAQRNRRIDEQVSRLHKEIAELTAQANPEIRDQIKLALAPDTDKKKPAAANATAATASTKQKPAKPVEPSKLPAEAAPELTAVLRLQAQIKALEKTKASPPVVIGIGDGGVPGSNREQIGDAPVLIRGDYRKEGPVVPRRFPEILAGADQVPLGSRTAGSGRLELAKWITAPDNALTWRVIANRIWLHLWREGLVRTPDNFGMLGEAPTHPELLDYLARRLLASGGSFKSLIREIMLSNAYQQSAFGEPALLKADPENRLLGRMNRKRLEYEALRDSLLFVSGQIGAKQRTLYEPILRKRLDQTRVMFDGPDPHTILPARSTTTTTPQALFLMNNPLVSDSAGRLAEHLLKDTAMRDDKNRVEKVYLQLLGRPPVAEELRIAEEYLAGNSWARYLQVLFCTNEFCYLD
jgi:hypothetical protein